MGQPKKRVARASRTGPARRTKDGRDFVFIETGNHGRHKNTHRNSVRNQVARWPQADVAGSEARGSSRRASPASSVVIERFTQAALTSSEIRKMSISRVTR